MQSDSDTLDWTLTQGWLPPAAAEQWRSTLLDSVHWQQPVVQVYGKHHPVPRQTAFLAEQGLTYRYSGTRHVGEGWTSWFAPLLEQINQASGCRFNGCLLNLYRDGDDRMGWHADDEPEIDQTCPIASLSLGATRDFQLKHRFEGDERFNLPLGDGDLLVMHPGCQQRWLHSVPQRRRIRSARINLTFRRFLRATG